MKTIEKLPIFLLALVLVGCTASASVPPPAPSLEVEEIQNPPPSQVVMSVPTNTQTALPEITSLPTEDVDVIVETILADVLSIKVTGEPNAYQFAVEVSSPDTGCDQYADWWEVASEDGQLLYRRVLLHSHVSEQPFIRSGGPVTIGENTVVVVRAHMSTGGYGGRALKGSVSSRFEAVELESDFASGVERQPPLPDDCAF